MQFARAYPDVEMILVGRQEVIESELKKHKTQGPQALRGARSDVVEMHEHTMAVREKSDASMNVAARLVRKGEADAFTTAGNTGAAMAAALFNIGRIKGIDRPALGTSLSPHSQSLLLHPGCRRQYRPAARQSPAVRHHGQRLCRGRSECP